MDFAEKCSKIFSAAVEDIDSRRLNISNGSVRNLWCALTKK